MTSIKIIDNLSNDQWIDFLEKNRDYNIFHTPYMMDVFRHTKKHEPFLLAAIDDYTKKIITLILPVKVNIYNGILGKLSSRMINYGGMIFNENYVFNGVINKVLDHYELLTAKGILFTEIRNMSETKNFKNSLIDSGYKYEDYLNFKIDLKKNPSNIFRCFSKGRKSDIKSLEKKGVYVKEISEAKEIEEVYDILSQIYSIVQVPIADISLFEKTYEYLYGRGMVKFFIAKLNEENIATLVTLLYKKTILTWYYGNSPEFKRLTGTSLLIWHLIKWGASNGYEILDFGGAGRPDEKYGVRDYKARFGGQLVNYGRYMKIHSPVKLNLAKNGYKIYRKFL